ncbi:MAG: hypothetical protein QXT39_03445 [Conexivisphaerales archaeon]
MGIGMSAEDTELERLMAKKLSELRKKVETESKPKSAKEILSGHLIDRGVEVLQTAEKQYPNETREIVDRLAELYRSGKISRNITGGELLWIFRRLGIDVRIETSIKVEEDGRFIDISEKLAKKE